MSSFVQCFDCFGPVVPTARIREIAAACEMEYALLYIRNTTVRFVHFALERMCQVMGYTGAVAVYADHFRQVAGEHQNAPVIDYQAGSLRDDFDFGSVLLVRASALRKAVDEMAEDYRYAGLYDLRLRLKNNY